MQKFPGIPFGNFMMANSREFLGLAANLLTSHAVNRNIHLSIIGYIYNRLSAGPAAAVYKH